MLLVSNSWRGILVAYPKGLAQIEITAHPYHKVTAI